MEYDQCPLPFMVTAFIFLFRFGGGVGMVKKGCFNKRISY